MQHLQKRLAVNVLEGMENLHLLSWKGFVKRTNSYVKRMHSYQDSARKTKGSASRFESWVKMGLRTRELYLEVNGGGTVRVSTIEDEC